MDYTINPRGRGRIQKRGLISLSDAGMLLKQYPVDWTELRGGQAAPSAPPLSVTESEWRAPGAVMRSLDMEVGEYDDRGRGVILLRLWEGLALDGLWHVVDIALFPERGDYSGQPPAITVPQSVMDKALAMTVLRGKAVSVDAGTLSVEV